MTLAEGISGCEQLASSVRRGPLAVELAVPVPPARHGRPPPRGRSLDKAFDELATFECDFVVDRFSLYVHDSEDGWVPTRDFALAPGPVG